MDLITHVLTGELIYKAFDSHLIRPAIYAGCVIPDCGEILIQNALAKKYGEKLAVYDERTSDFSIASEIQVTYLYDLLHSPLFSISIMTTGIILVSSGSEQLGNIILSFGIGLFSHFILDCFTHGKVWALKIFFPFSNKRFPLLENKVGNWWDWQPSIKLPILEFPFPISCVFIWFIIILVAQSFKS